MDSQEQPESIPISEIFVVLNSIVSCGVEPETRAQSSDAGVAGKMKDGATMMETNSLEMDCEDRMSLVNNNVSDSVDVFSGFRGLMNDIHLLENSKPIAYVVAKDKEGANERNLGKDFGIKECTQGVRCNSPNENVQYLEKNQVSYAGMVTKGVFGSTIRTKLCAKSSMVLDYSPFKRDGGIPRITLAPDPGAMEKWEKCLVGYFIVSKLPFHVVRKKIFELWSKQEVSNEVEEGSDYGSDDSLSYKGWIEDGKATTRADLALTSSKGLLPSDYPSDWSNKKIRKEIKAMKNFLSSLSGNDPP